MSQYADHRLASTQVKAPEQADLESIRNPVVRACTSLETPVGPTTTSRSTTNLTINHVLADMSTLEYIPAALLFSVLDLPTFLQWRQLHAPNADPGRIRHALEYYEYIHRDEQSLRRTDITSKHVALSCGHALHPSDTRTRGYCPVCEIRMSLEFLDRISSVFGGAGGPWNDPRGTRQRYFPLRKGWHMARLELERTLDVMRMATKHEALWEGQHVFDAAVVNKTHTSAKALRLGVMESKYPAVITPGFSLAVTRGMKRKRGEGKKNKMLSFAPLVTCRSDSYSHSTDPVNFEQGRKSWEYCRSSSAYEPGLHAAPNGDNWIDTSHCTSEKDAANLRNTKVFVTDSVEAFKLLKNYPYACIGELQGILGLHSARDAIWNYILQWARLKVLNGEDGEAELE
jgi:hypothetical protein